MTYAIGDVHGMYDELLELLRTLPLNDGDELIFLGDYVDRGPSSKNVVDFLDTLKGKYEVTLLKGNHEDMLLNCIDKGECGVWHFNGAYATIRSFGGIEKIKDYLNFLKSLKTFHIKRNFLFVHAGVKPGVDLKSQKEWDMLWIRDEFIFSKNPLPGYIVVFGHTPFEKPIIMDDKIGIDTGCVYGGKLTAIRLDDMKIFSVRCR